MLTEPSSRCEPVGAGLLDGSAVGHADATAGEHQAGERPARSCAAPHRTGSGASSGTSGSGLCRSGSPTRRGRVSRNCAPSPGSPQACSQPPCRWASSSAIDSPSPVPPRGPGAGRVGPPEPVEHHRRLAGRQPDAVVAHRDRDGLLVAGDPDGHHDGAVALAVLDRVGDQVAHDPLDPAYVDLGQHGVVRRLDLEPRRRAARPAARVASTTRRATSTQVDVLGLEHGGARVEPADLQQVGEQRLEAVELGLQQLGRARGRRVEVARARRAARRRPSAPWSAACAARGRRRRRTGAAPGDSSSSWRIWRCRLAAIWLNDVAEPGDVVLAAHVHPLLEPAGREPLGDPAGQPHRGDDLPGDQPGDARDQHEQQDARR